MPHSSSPSPQPRRQSCICLDPSTPSPSRHAVPQLTDLIHTQATRIFPSTTYPRTIFICSGPSVTIYTHGAGTLTSLYQKLLVEVREDGEGGGGGGSGGSSKTVALAVGEYASSEVLACESLLNILGVVPARLRGQAGDGEGEREEVKPVGVGDLDEFVGICSACGLRRIRNY